MQVKSSVKSRRGGGTSQMVRRKGALYVICKTNPRFKMRQGQTTALKRRKRK